MAGHILRVLDFPHSMQQQKHLVFWALFPSHHAPTPSLFYSNHHRLKRFSCRSSLGGLPEVPYSGAQKALPSHYHKFPFSRHASIEAHHGRAGQCLTVCRSKSMDEFPVGDGPVELPRPGFSRLPHSSLSFIPVDDPAAAPPPPGKVKIRTRRGRRSWKKTTPAQAMTGAVVGALWAALALKGTTLAYEHLDSHPLAHNLPMGLTNNVNQLLLTVLTGFGGFVVLMFGVSSCGLALLTLKLLSAPKTPLQ